MENAAFSLIEQAPYLGAVVLVVLIFVLFSWRAMRLHAETTISTCGKCVSSQQELTAKLLAALIETAKVVGGNTQVMTETQQVLGSTKDLLRKNHDVLVEVRTLLRKTNGS